MVAALEADQGARGERGQKMFENDSGFRHHDPLSS
jgi:hypothetical protein